MKIPKWIIHVTGCVLFLAIPFFVAPGRFNQVTLFSRMLVWRDLTAFVIILAFFYLNYFVLIPAFYFQNKKLQYAAVATFTAIVVLMLPQALLPIRGDLTAIPGIHIADVNQLFVFLTALFASMFWRINSEWRHTQQQKLHAELSYLRGQVNPHFLFNTLNSIYSLAIEKSDDTATALVKLSWMMRYVISESTQDRVLLYKEISYIRSYVELQQYRFSHTVNISFFVDGDAAGKKIAPIMLIPFVENAFKHGVNAEEDSRIKISIQISSQYVTMRVENNKVRVTLKDEEKSGLGIENTRHRLELLYPGKHELKIENGKKTFAVHLKLEL
ncbi:MAG: histidine kinase [Chitinophagales bacterium]